MSRSDTSFFELCVYSSKYYLELSGKEISFLIISKTRATFSSKYQICATSSKRPQRNLNPDLLRKKVWCHTLLVLFGLMVDFYLQQIVAWFWFADPPCVPKLLPQNLESPVLPAALPSCPVYTARVVPAVAVHVPPGT